MKKLIFTFLSIGLLALQVNAQQNSPKNQSKYLELGFDQEETVKKTKEFSKSFLLSKDDKIDLKNQRGSITLKKWDKSEIKVDAEIKVFAMTESEAQEVLDKATITASKEANLVSFKTELDEVADKLGSTVDNGKLISGREIRINYVVYLPTTNALTLSAVFGNITLDDFAAPINAKINFGDFTAKNLNAPDNSISVSFGNLKIDAVSDLNLDLQHSQAEITTIKGYAKIKQRFGEGVTIGSVDDLDLNLQHSDITFTTLRGNLIAKTQFSKLKINEIEKGCKNLDINGEHSNLNLNFSSNYDADINVSTNRSDFNYDNRVTAKKLSDDEDKYFKSSQVYTGKIGKGGHANVNIKTSYGSVRFN